MWEALIKTVLSLDVLTALIVLVCAALVYVIHRLFNHIVARQAPYEHLQAKLAELYSDTLTDIAELHSALQVCRQETSKLRHEVVELKMLIDDTKYVVGKWITNYPPQEDELKELQVKLRRGRE